MTEQTDRPRLVLALLAVSMIGASTLYAQDDLELLEQQAFHAALQRIAPAVVRIETVGGLERVGSVLFGTGPTTGLVVGADGYILSSLFNFSNNPASVLVVMPDGRREAARIVATDHNRMLVLLKVDVEQPLAVPDFAPTSEIRTGAWAIAVGRTFPGSQPNMALGIVSAVNRIWGKAIQTDAAVSPNNYGGPLVDLRGRVLGLLTPLSPNKGGETAGMEWYDSGIGFAIPAEDLESIVQRLRQGEDLHGGLMGIALGKGALHMAEPVISAARPNSPAYDAGFKAGDRIVEIDGQAITRAAQVKEHIARKYAGESLHVVVTRDGQRIEREITLAAKLEPYEHPFLGVLPMRIVADNASDDGPRGVAVRHVYAESPAAAAGIEPGDVLLAMAGDEIDDPQSLRPRISERKPDEQVEFSIRRNDRTRTVVVTLGRLPEALPTEDLPPSHPPVAAVELEDIEVGRIELKIPDAANEAWAYVPQSYNPSVPHGVLVWFHGAEQVDQAGLLARWKPHCDRHDLILLVPSAVGDEGKWRPNDAEFVVKLLDQIRSTYTVDAARVVVFGRKEGGQIAYLAAFHSRRLVAAVATNDSPVAGRPPENEPVHRLAFFVAKSRKSPAGARIDQAVARLRSMKYPITVHDLGPDPRQLSEQELADMARWFDTLDRI